jgi:RNA polymerase sigma-70 factor (ECF subfamily)
LAHFGHFKLTYEDTGRLRLPLAWVEGHYPSLVIRRRMNTRQAQDEKTRRFVALMGANDRRLFGYVLSLVPNFADAEELSQQVRLRLWEQFDAYDPEKDFGAWAKTIAHYLILAYRKSTAVARVRFSDQAIEAIAQKFDVVTKHDDDRKWAMQECLARLAESKRKVLVRYYSTGESLREIATEFGRSFDSVRHSVLRSRLALAECIERTLRREGM